MKKYWMGFGLCFLLFAQSASGQIEDLDSPSADEDIKVISIIAESEDEIDFEDIDDADESQRITEKTIISPQAICTEVACPANVPCCNTCSVDYWSDGSGTMFEMESGSLPSCALDGCGQCPFSLEVSGYTEGSIGGNIFVIQSFERTDPVQLVDEHTEEPAMNDGQILMQRIQQAAEDNEESDESVDLDPQQIEAQQRFLEAIQQKQEENDHELAVEDPEQYEENMQAREEFINLFQPNDTQPGQINAPAVNPFVSQ